MKFLTVIFLLFFVGNLSAQRTYDLKTSPLEGESYLKVTNGHFIFWIEHKVFCDIFSDNDFAEIKNLLESITETVSIDYLTTEISKITQKTEDIDEEIRYIIWGKELLIERVSDGLFLSEYTILTNEKIRSIVDNQGQLILKDWEIRFRTIGTPSF